MGLGYAGKILRVDLTREIIRDEELDENLVGNFLGGPGLGAKILFDEVPPRISPFDPENKLIFMTGLLTGTPVPAGARYAVIFKSPQTGGYGEATARWHERGSFGGRRSYPKLSRLFPQRDGGFVGKPGGDGLEIPGEKYDPAD